METETSAIGSCIYDMHFGHPPWSESLEEEMNQKCCSHEYPPTGDDEIGAIIQMCWDGEFENGAAFDAVVKTLHSDGVVASRPSWLKAWSLRSECKLFLARDRLIVVRERRTRLQVWGWRCL